MPTIAEVRQQFPQYDDMSDDQLVNALHKKFYSDMPRDEFLGKVGVPGARIAGAFDAAKGQPDKLPRKRVSGSILPFSRDEQGNVSFDSDAGIVGSIKRGLMAPSQAMSGELPMYAFDPHTGETGTSPQMLQGATDLAALASPINPAARAGDTAIPGVKQALRRAHVEPPTAQRLQEVGGAGYDAVRDMAVDYRSSAVKDLADTMAAKLERDGINDELAPKTFSILKELASPPDGSVAPLSGIETARRQLGNAAKDFQNPTEQAAAMRAISGLKDFVASPDPASVVAGPARTAGRRLREADANYGAGKRSDKLHGIEEVADLNAAVANSGQNIDNAIRQRARDIIDPRHPERRTGFSKAEIKIIETVAKGTTGRNTLRYVGNLLGGGGGLGGAVVGMGAGAVGGVAGGPAGVALGLGLPAVGMVAKRSAGALTRKQLQRADEMVRKRSPEYERMLQEAPMEAPDALKRAALIRALLLAEHDRQR